MEVAMKEDRIEKLLAGILLQQMKQASQADKIVTLSSIGFTNVEIADLLRTTAAVVAQTLYAERRTKGRKPTAKREKKKKSGGSRKSH
jgi:hypothetical protein